MPPRTETLVIKDSSVVIDLVNAGLFPLWFSLGIRTMTTDFVESELRKGSQWDDVAPLITDGLFVIDRLLREEVITFSRAIAALTLLVSKGGRLPEVEVTTRLEQWSQGRMK